MKILALIPARGGSKGIPGKNIKILGGKPLIAYSIEAAKESRYISKVVVSTDDQSIYEIANQYGAETPFLRPAELSTDTARSVDVVIHALSFLDSINEHFDAVCLLQPTSPFRAKGFIDACIESFIHQKTDSLVSTRSIPDEYNPHWTFEADEQGHLHIATGEKTIISRRQDLPKAYIRDGAVYLTKTEVLKNSQSLYGETLSFKESTESFHVNLDTEEDWYLAEKFLADKQ